MIAYFGKIAYSAVSQVFGGGVGVGVVPVSGGVTASFVVGSQSVGLSTGGVGVGSVGVGCCTKFVNSLMYSSNCAKYQVRLSICFPFAISSKNVVAFLDMKSQYLIIVLLFIAFPCARKLFPWVA
jgi:hypothetical protein